MGWGPCADFQLGPRILANITQTSRYKKAESNLLEDEKVPTIWAR